MKSLTSYLYVLLTAHVLSSPSQWCWCPSDCYCFWLCQSQYLPNDSSGRLHQERIPHVDQKNPQKIQIHNPKSTRIHWGNAFIRATQITYRSQYQKTLPETNVLQKQPKRFIKNTQTFEVLKAEVKCIELNPKLWRKLKSDISNLVNKLQILS